MFRRNKESGETKPDEDNSGLNAPPLRPFASKGTHTPAKPPTRAPSLNGGGPGAAPKRPIDIPSAPSRLDRHRSSESDSKTLVVGRDIRLAGEITACERLVIEGHVEVSLSSAHLIEVAPSGVFKGNAQVEDADISGLVDGELTVSNKLTVRAGGKINGSVRYGSIIIEAGGEVCGDMQALNPPPKSNVLTPETLSLDEKTKSGKSDKDVDQA